MTYPLIGNYGRLVDDDQSSRPWLRALVVANATAAVLDDARQLAALLRDAGIPAIAGVDTARARTPPADQRFAAGGRPGARRDGCGRGSFGRPGRAALGGPGLRRPGLAGRGHRAGRSIRGRAAHRHRRLRAEGEHRPVAAPARGAGPDPAPHGQRRGRPRRRCRRARPVARSRRPRAARWAGGARPRGDRRWTAAARDLPRPPDRGPRRGGGHAAAPVRASRREPPGPRRRPRPRPGDRPEPRGHGGRRDPAGPRRVPRQPGEPQRRLGRGAAPPRAADRDGPVPPRRARPGRSTRWPCSTGSSRRRRSGPAGERERSARTGRSASRRRC